MFARVNAIVIAGEEAARQHGHMLLCIKAPRKICICYWRFGPQVKTRLRFLRRECSRKQVQNLLKFLPVKTTIFDDVGLVRPGRGTCRLGCRRQGATMISSIEEEFFYNPRITGDEAGAQPG